MGESCQERITMLRVSCPKITYKVHATVDGQYDGTILVFQNFIRRRPTQHF